MRGFWAMLTGKGEEENRKLHKSFNDAIPDSFSPELTEEQKQALHPAYSGPMSNSMVAADYRRANQMRGPKSKQEHAQAIRRRDLIDQYHQAMTETPAGEKKYTFAEWLKANGLTA